MVNSNYYAMVKVIVFFTGTQLNALLSVVTDLTVLGHHLTEKEMERGREVSSLFLRASLLCPWHCCLQLISVRLFSTWSLVLVSSIFSLLSGISEIHLDLFIPKILPAISYFDYNV